MPSIETLNRFIAKVASNAHVEAIEMFYTPDASMQENNAEPRVGRARLAAHEREVLARMASVKSTCIHPVFVEGDRVVIRWLFEFVRKDGTALCIDELAYQRWRGEQIAEEKFYYDPQQMQPAGNGRLT
jgi:ketosteroid isomerase-like protein